LQPVDGDIETSFPQVLDMHGSVLSGGAVMAATLLAGSQYQ
jgi:hypothetical protein